MLVRRKNGAPPLVCNGISVTNFDVAQTLVNKCAKVQQARNSDKAGKVPQHTDVIIDDQTAFLYDITVELIPERQVPSAYFAFYKMDYGREYKLMAEKANH